MKKLLWVGDAGVPSGFAKATHNILDYLCYHYAVTVLGINYRGDPHSYSYPIYAAAVTGDAFGVGRLIWMCDLVRPDVVVLQNDGWNIPPYVQRMRQFKEYADVPVVAIVAVDGKNFQASWLKDVAHAIFWTQFALDEARRAGYDGPASVIPLGVDRTIYHPMDRAEMRQRRFPEQLHDKFIVGNVNRNQPRKRWDLLIRYFAKWIKEYDVRDAYLYLHTAPTGDTGINVVQLATYYGVSQRLATVTPETWYGMSEEELAEQYNCFDVNASTTQGEGFGLTTLESMACGVPQILPDWSALGDWPRGAATLIPCATTAVGPPYVNVIGGVPDEEKFIQALNFHYNDVCVRETNSKAALERASESRFDWSNVGNRYLDVLSCVFGEHAWLDVTALGDAVPHLFCSTCGVRKKRLAEARQGERPQALGQLPQEEPNVPSASHMAELVEEVD